jgi:hypothetical protein
MMAWQSGPVLVIKGLLLSCIEDFLLQNCFINVLNDIMYGAGMN